MKEAFIIMQIGNSQLDSLFNDSIIPAIEACGLRPRRVDKHNRGGLLKNEIVGFLERCEIIIADLTNERPNCYLEVGYAMGLDKFRNLLLTAREDHSADSPNHTVSGPRIHFDLNGYDILFWHPEKQGDFKKDLEARIRRRLALLASAVPAPTSAWDDEWLREQREKALAGWQHLGSPGLMEVRFAVEPPKPTRTSRELLDAARSSRIHTFGWPIGIILDSRDEFRPHPRADGIVTEVCITNPPHVSYDYWALRKNVDYFLLKSLFEDTQQPNFLVVNTRIVRVAEAVLYCLRLYDALRLEPTTEVSLAIRHAGLRGRSLFLELPMHRTNVAEDEIESMIHGSLTSIEAELPRIVKDLCDPLFALFDFYEPPLQHYEGVITKFMQAPSG